MTFDELAQMKRDAEQLERDAKTLDFQREQLVRCRQYMMNGGDKPLLTISRKTFDRSQLQTWEQALNEDLTPAVAAGLIRVTEMRLEREARVNRILAERLRTAMDQYLSHDVTHDPVSGEVAQ